LMISKIRTSPKGKVQVFLGLFHSYLLKSIIFGVVDFNDSTTFLGKSPPRFDKIDKQPKKHLGEVFFGKMRCSQSDVSIRPKRGEQKTLELPEVENR
jgi:hypothetical protein